MTSVMSKEWAVLHGAFLRAEKLCCPSSLACLQKDDWSRVGRPVLEAVRELCGAEDLETGPPDATLSVSWRKRVLCAVWLKLQSAEAGEDVETAWRENPFFPVQKGLPEVNHAVLLEVAKSTAAAQIFARFLLCLPQSQIRSELQRLVEHVKSSPTTDQDVHFFLEVWWELWRGPEQQKEGAQGDSIETTFSRQFARLCSQSSSVNPKAAKRLKLDTTSPVPADPDVLHILLHALKDIKDHISTTDRCLQALSVSLDALYTTFLIDKAVVLSTEESMHLLSRAISIKRESAEKSLTPDVIRQAQTDIRASHTPSRFGSSGRGGMELGEALKMLTEIVQFWQNGGLLLSVCDGADDPSYSAFRLEQSVRRVLPALQKAQSPETTTGAGTDDRNALVGLLESLAFPAIEIGPEVNSKVSTVIITHRLEGYRSYASLFAGEKSWAARDDSWMCCVEKNRAAFQQRDTLIKLTSTLMSELGGGDGGSTNVSRCKRLMKVIADIFSALPLADKNKALAAMLRLSRKGFFGHASSSVPSALRDGFDQELNMAFNCIIQGRAGASESNLNTAVALVARVAFQNPEAALRSCCHSAIFNKSAFSLMAKILLQLPGLTGQEEEEGSGVLCSCLQEAIQTKSLSANEKEQLVQFLGLLMKPGPLVEGAGRRTSFLSPQEVVNTFVLPNLSTKGQSNFDRELSVQLLHTALCVEVQAAATAPHWVLDCSPFPLLYVLAQLHCQALRCWEQPAEGAVHHWSMESRELLVSVLSRLAEVVGAEVAASPCSWSRALFWLYNKMEGLDWTVRFHLKPVWGEHFKNEVPSALLTVCELPEQEWSGLALPQYGQGTGLLAWMECCCISDSLQSTMLSHLSLDQRRPDHVGMFSKGLLVALTQTLPWCSVSQWSRLLRGLRELITSGRLNVPFSLEYVDYLPLLDLKSFSCELRLSVLLLRALQLLCGSSCSDWLSAEGWGNVGRLYAHAVRDMIQSLRAKLPLPTAAAPSSKTQASADSNAPGKSPQTARDLTQAEDVPLKAEESHMAQEDQMETAPSQEVLFVLSQLFCHVQHIQVMMPGGQCEPLFLCCLELLSHYESIMGAFPHSSSPLESHNTRHFFTTITDNLQSQEMKAVLQHKIAQLVSGAA